MVAPFCIYEQLSKMKLKLSKLLPALLLCIGMLTGCGTDDSLQFVELSLTTQQTEQIPSGSVEVGDSQQCFFDLSQIPEYAGDAYVTVNGNIPFFTHNESTGQSFETYSPLDELGRCGTAFA